MWSSNHDPWTDGELFVAIAPDPRIDEKKPGFLLDGHSYATDAIEKLKSNIARGEGVVEVALGARFRIWVETSPSRCCLFA